MSGPFKDRLQAAQRSAGTSLCVGLDVDPRRLPAGLSPDRSGVERFIAGIVEATSDLVSAYKPNLAFFEALGADGWDLIESTRRRIPSQLITIADGKRNDIGNTSERYASALFDVWGFDAATVNPYPGLDGIAPFLANPERGVFLLCKTSNPGSADFQDVLCEFQGQRMPLYEVVARRALSWNQRENVGLVVGATYPEELTRVCDAAPGLPLLLPGIGTQGGDVEAVQRLIGASDGPPVVVSVSRQILYASSGDDWAAAARKETEALRTALDGRPKSGGPHHSDPG